MKIVCVCKSGGEYNASHVDRLSEQVRQYHDIEFVALTDPGLQWPGWWAKMHAFALKGPLLYLDLDTVILDNLDPLLEVAERETFVAMRDPNQHQRELMSSIMAWSGDMSHLYETFKKDPEKHMAEYTTPRWWGDQGFVEYHQPDRKYWQDLLPGMVRSYKKECLSGVPDGTRVLIFHGQPRPWQAGY